MSNATLAPRDATRVSVGMNPKPLRVVLADDHAIVLEAVAALVDEAPGLRVVGKALTVEEALALVATEGPDVLVTDLGMGSEGGLDFIRRVTRAHPKLPVVVLSMFSEDVFAERALRAGALGYVMKDHTSEDLVSAIREVARDRIYLSRSLKEEALRRMTGRSQDEAGSVSSLTDRELEVFRLVGSGLTTREVAERLSLSVKTVETHRMKIMRKLELENAHQLVHRAIVWLNEEMGLL